MGLINPTYTNTPDLSVVFRNLALSEGHAPIDFIPNDTASQVDVASETIQFDPVKLAKAVGVFGPELNPDPTFATQWDTANEGISVSGGKIVFDDVALVDRTFYVRIPPTTGQLILVEVDVDELDGSLNALYGGHPSIITTAGKHKFLIGPTSAAGTAGIFAQTDGTNAVISRFSAREVTMPEALTFLMKGTETYADSGKSTEALLLNWEEGGTNNRLRLRLRTHSGRTGQIEFMNFTDLEGLSSALSANDAYTPGVEVPFSLAFVLSATEIEGFVNGVSTGKVAYGGMANLLSSSLHLLQSGTATLEEFHIWAEALPSAAMQEATS